MKRLSLYLFLILFTLQTPSFADDIQDLEIEGISIGDSALDYFDLGQVNKAKEDLYCSYTKKLKCSDFYSATFWHLPKFKIYDAVRYHAKNKDRKHIIYEINGQIFFPDNFEGCLKRKEDILLDISEMLKDLKKKYEGTSKHAADKSGKSFTTSVEYYFSNGDSLTISCYNWSKEMDHPHTLHVDLAKGEFLDWLDYIYQ